MDLADQFIKRTAPALSFVIGHIRNVTARLTPDSDWVESTKRYGAVSLDPLFRPLGRPLIFECHDKDYFTTAAVDSDKVEGVIFPKYQRNLTSTRKFRMVNGERQWANGSWVYDPDTTEWQHHVYLFDNDDGTCDMYGHEEASAKKDPFGHVEGEQKHGDPRGFARAKLSLHNVNHNKHD